jgi:hypothetical protein
MAPSWLSYGCLRRRDASGIEPRTFFMPDGYLGEDYSSTLASQHREDPDQAHRQDRERAGRRADLEIEQAARRQGVAVRTLRPTYGRAPLSTVLLFGFAGAFARCRLRWRGPLARSARRQVCTVQRSRLLVTGVRQSAIPWRHVARG